MAKYLSLYGTREGQCITMQSPTPAQLKIFKAILLTEEQYNTYISSNKEDRELLLQEHRAASPEITGEKKKLIQSMEVVAPVAPKEIENKVETAVETTTEPIIENISEPASEIIEEKIEDVVLKEPAKKAKKSKKK